MGASSSVPKHDADTCSISELEDDIFHNHDCRNVLEYEIQIISSANSLLEKEETAILILVVVGVLALTFLMLLTCHVCCCNIPIFSKIYRRIRDRKQKSEIRYKKFKNDLQKLVSRMSTGSSSV